MTKSSRLEIMVKGRVQGVGYRRSIFKEAAKLKLAGYVKNLEDGSVEIIAEGPKNKLIKLLDFSYNGSFLARVINVSFI